MSIPKYIEVRSVDNRGRGLFTTIKILKDENMIWFTGVVKGDEESNVESLQIDDDKFLESQDSDNFLNHSCEPNCRIDWNTMWLTALRDIKMGEELTYDYHTSDWDNFSLKRKDPAWFKCSCGAPQCVGKMYGFKYLSLEERISRLEDAAPYIKKKLT